MADILIPGVSGRIELRYLSQEEDETAPVAMILHPHPKKGGTMNNKIIHHIAKGYQECGFSTVVFNFRGVGRSGGKYTPSGEGELADSSTVLDWVQKHYPIASKIWITGYSYGSWIAMQLLMRRPEIASFVVVAPPASTYDYTFLAPCPTSGLIIYAQDDKLAPAEDVISLIELLKSQHVVTIDSSCIENSDHFFTNCIDNMKKQLTDYVCSNIKNNTAL